MSLIAKDVWDRLQNEAIREETLWARQASLGTTDRLLAALDSDGKRHFLISLADNEEDVGDLRSRGLAVYTQQLEGAGHPLGRYINLVCLDPAGHEAFDLIGNELAARLGSGQETASECVSRVISKWRRFWQDRPKNLLSTYEQLGLFAELWFLALWLVPKIGLKEAVGGWRGPLSSRHDFEWIGRSIEVKATSSATRETHTINGLDQLAPPESGTLMLFSLQTREERGATNSLASMVSLCRNLLESDAELANIFEAKLLEVGYSDFYREDYESLTLRVVAQKLYEVRDDFPRLTSRDFANGLPPGVTRLQYEIELSGFTHLCIAQSPNDFSTI